MAGAEGRDADPPAPDGRPAALPLPVFLAFLRRLHDGPPQHAAAVRVSAIDSHATEYSGRLPLKTVFYRNLHRRRG